MTRTRFASSLVFALALVACGDPATSDDAGTDAHVVASDDAFIELRPSCETIIGRCHDVDPGSGPIHDCHETAHDHDSTEAICAAMLDECVMLCTAVDAGVPASDAGEHEHNH